jgi:tRNA(adenine34) deaminase
MREQDFKAVDISFMRRCVSVAQFGVSKGEHPFGAVVSRGSEFICEAHNMVRAEGDVTRHAEMVALSVAQKKLRSNSLDDCTLYSTVEPCAMCSYAIRETRVGRVISGLRSPIMGGYSRWNILADGGLSSVVPLAFASPPEIHLGCLHDEVREAFRKCHPLASRVIEAQKIFVAEAEQRESRFRPKPDLKQRLATWARTHIFDRVWRV